MTCQTLKVYRLSLTSAEMRLLRMGKMTMTLNTLRAGSTFSSEFSDILAWNYRVEVSVKEETVSEQFVD